jgi:hypothetical protein
MFLKREIWNVIHVMLRDKAPGPDRFTGLFYHSLSHNQKGYAYTASFQLLLGAGLPHLLD